MKMNLKSSKKRVWDFNMFFLDTFNGFQCPYYEEHSGEYYQGCYEFNNLCWLGPITGGNYTCHSDCWMFTGDEQDMLNTCLDALHKDREVWRLNAPPTHRELTKYEQDSIMEAINTFSEIMNSEISFYK